MSDPAPLDADDESHQPERATAYAVVYEAVRRATHVESPEELAAQTLGAWLAAYGLATLWLSGNLPYPRDPADVTGEFACANATDHRRLSTSR